MVIDTRKDPRELERKAYDSKASSFDRAKAMFELVDYSPEVALNIFARRKDQEGLEYLSRNPLIPVQVRRNAYLERGFQYSVKDLEGGVIPSEKSIKTSPYRSKLTIEEKKQKKEQERLEKERQEQERKSFLAFLRSMGITEEEYNQHQLDAQHARFCGGSVIWNRPSTSSEPNPWQENAIRAYEGGD